ncbi:Myb-related protein A [Seminavis robusta]|uniref:Myb-related protein A n=1 Tax=Seminavis robusta TaxID=568900 RepID=A0A9N8DQL8_9STRA|nr:Myb-related protein A [Seminavis robusta]|eukprot:Sro213_g088600.1 Myb-related protein A (563) ;mRNA; r:82644-84332
MVGDGGHFDELTRQHLIQTTMRQQQEPPMLSEESSKTVSSTQQDTPHHHGLNNLCEAILTREMESKTKDSTMEHKPLPASLQVSSQAQAGQSNLKVRASKTRPTTQPSPPNASPFQFSTMLGHSALPTAVTIDDEPMHHPWPPRQPFVRLFGNGQRPPHLPSPFIRRDEHMNHPAQLFRQPFVPQPVKTTSTMDYEVFDVDNDTVLLEQQQQRPVTQPSNAMFPSNPFVTGDPSSSAMGIFPPHVRYPAVQQPQQHPMPTNRSTIGQDGQSMHAPVVVQTGFGPALLLPVSPSVMTSPPPLRLSPNPSSFHHMLQPRGPAQSPITSVDVEDDDDSTETSNDDDVSILSPPTQPTKVQDTRFQRWTEEEDQLLTRATSEQGGPPYNWNRIATKYFPTSRTGPQCKARWKKALKPGLKRGNWDPEEDRLIVQLHAEGLKWTEIAERIPGRVPDHLRQRFMNALDPKKKKTPWTQAENKILYEAQKRLGNKWSEMSKLIPGRSENDIKNRWHNAKMAQRRKLRRMANHSARRTPLAGQTSLGTPIDSAASPSPASKASPQDICAL